MCDSWLRFVLRFRFTKPGMAVEAFLLNNLGAIYFSGDQVAWVGARTKAYYMWHEGRTKEWITKCYHIPGFFVNNWIIVWTAYDTAWGWLNE